MADSRRVAAGVLVRRKATKAKTLTGPYFTTRRTTFNPLYRKYDHFVHSIWLNISVCCSLGGKNRQNRTATPRACFACGGPTTGQRAGADNAEVVALQPASSSGLHQRCCSPATKKTHAGRPGPATAPPPEPPPEPHLLWFISLLPALFLPGPQLWRRRGESERMLLLKSEGRRGTSVSLSLASSASPPPPPPPPAAPEPAVPEAPAWMPSTGLQLHSSPWLPSRLELEGQTLAVSSVEEQETETSLVLSPPPVTASSCCGQPTHICLFTHISGPGGAKSADSRR